MFCQNCGEKVINPGKYCEFCGNFINTEQGTAKQEDAVQGSKVFNQRLNLTKKQKVCILAVSFLLIGMYIAYQVVAGFNSPEYVVQCYYSSLAEGDYSKAFDYVTVPDGQLINRESFSSYMKYAYDNNRIELFRIERDKSKDGSRPKGEPFNYKVEVSYKLKGSSQTRNDIINLTQSSGKNLLFFPDWKIAVDDILQSEWIISVPKGAKLVIDGKEISRENITGEVRHPDYSYYVNDGAKMEKYTIRNVLPGSYKIKTVIDGSKDNSGQYDTVDVEIRNQPDEELEQTIKDTVNGLFNAFPSAKRGTDAGKIEEYAVKDSDFIREINWRYALKSSGQYDFDVASIEYTGIHLDDAYHARASLNGSLRITQSGSTPGDNSYSNEASISGTYFLKKIDDKWKIYHSN